MLFCRRCHRYDCFLHKEKQATPNLNIEPKNNSSNYRPCSSQCYRIISKEKKIELRRSYSEIADHRTSTNGYHTRRPKFTMTKSDPINSWNGLSMKSSLKRQLTDDVCQWSASEKSLFRVFYTIYGDNICLIADLLDKPCSQVYNLYMKEIETHERKQPALQRQNSEASTSTIGSFSAVTSTTSSDSIGTKNNEIGEKATTSNGDEMIVCNGKQHEQQSVGQENLLINETSRFIDQFTFIIISSIAFIIVSSSTTSIQSSSK